MAMVKDMSAGSFKATGETGGELVEGNQAGFVRQDIHAPVRDNRRNIHRSSEIHLTSERSGSRVGADQETFRRHQPEPAAGKHGSTPAGARRQIHYPSHSAFRA